MGMTLEELIEAAREATAPSIPSAEGLPRPGGVDPLGLRQLNFELMDATLPGVNNVARLLRPYVVVAWAARRAGQLSDTAKIPATPAMIRDFIDRVEVIYAWSQFALSEGEAIEGLPGRRVLSTNQLSRKTYRFGGEAWEHFRKSRTGSTAFTAAITYGPSIKALDWAGPKMAPAWGPSPRVNPALNAFEASIASVLDHPAFSRFGPVTVTRGDVEAWGSLWSLDDPTIAEQDAFAYTLAGDGAKSSRRRTMALVSSLVETKPDLTIGNLRAAMSELAGDDPARKDWRRLQVRQAFRLALESWFWWSLCQLEAGPLPTSELIARFRNKCDGWAASDRPGSWLKAPRIRCPVALQERLSGALRSNFDGIPAEVARTLAFCFTEIDPEGDAAPERADRLPLRRARHEAKGWSGATPEDFLSHMLHNWLFAQHAYWSAGRGMAEVRARRSAILRLRVALDEGGWRLTRVGSRNSRPYATEDRLETVCKLASQCGLFN